MQGWSILGAVFDGRPCVYPVGPVRRAWRGTREEDAQAVVHEDRRVCRLRAEVPAVRQAARGRPEQF